MSREEIASRLAGLYDLTMKLRAECPWDRKQTQETIIAYTLEETYELADAIHERAARGARRATARAPATMPSAESWATCSSRCTSWRLWPRSRGCTTWATWRPASTPSWSAAIRTSSGTPWPRRRGRARDLGRHQEGGRRPRGHLPRDPVELSRPRSWRRSCSSGRRRWASIGSRPRTSWPRWRRRRRGDWRWTMTTGDPRAGGRPRWAICSSRWSILRVNLRWTPSWPCAARPCGFRERVEAADGNGRARRARLWRAWTYASKRRTTNELKKEQKR